MADTESGSQRLAKDAREPYSARNRIPRAEGWLEGELAKAGMDRLLGRNGSQVKSGSRASDSASDMQADHDNRQREDIADVPIITQNTNTLFHPSPDIDLKDSFLIFFQRLNFVLLLSLLCVVLLSFLFNGHNSTSLAKSLALAIAVFATVKLVLEYNSAINIEAEAKPLSERLKYVPESVEWLNSLVGTIWTVIDSKVFEDAARQIDAVLSDLMPSNKVSVRIAEIGHGTSNIRVLSIRSLPDEEFGEMVPSHGNEKFTNKQQKMEREKAAAREEGGVFYNLELTVAYHCEAFAKKSEKMHCDIHVRLFGILIPIYFEATELMVTMRIRFQMHSAAPFLKYVTFALVNTPRVGASVTLGAPWTMNLLNIPVIHSVYNWQLKNFAKEFVQPKSMGLDMTQYLGGSSTIAETETIGLVYIRINRGRNLPRQDTRGPGADPYVVISMSQYEKPMYASRIIKGDRNPIWGEHTYLLIRPEYIRRGEHILLRIWDSDRSSADDISGQIEVPLHTLVEHPGKLFQRSDHLTTAVGLDSEGVVEWELGFFPRCPLKRELRTNAMDPRDIHGNIIKLPEEQQTQSVKNTKPDPEYPTGIVGIKVNQLVAMELENTSKKSLGTYKKVNVDSEGNVVSSENVDVGYFPSFYCTIHVNELLVFRTRTRLLSKQPIFNRSVEHFVRHFPSAEIKICVWDAQEKGKDVFVGAAKFRLRDVLTDASSITELMRLEGGAGEGKARISVIFRSVELKFPRNYLAWPAGSWRFDSPLFVAPDSLDIRKIKIKAGASVTVLTSQFAAKADGEYVFEFRRGGMHMPVKYRHMTPLIFKLTLGSTIGKKRVYAILWLTDLADHERREHTLPVYDVSNVPRFLQNYNIGEHDEFCRVKQVGHVKFSGSFEPLMS